MNIEKKACLLVVSLTLVLVLLNVVPAVVSSSGVDHSLSASRNDFSLSQTGTIEPLETTINLVGTHGSGGWYVSDVTVTFSVFSSADEYTTAYSYDGENWIIYSDAFVVSTEGDTTIYYNSTDSSGFIEGTKEEIIRIDKTAPELNLETENVPGEGTFVTLSAIEYGSGLASIAYSLDGKRLERYVDPFNISTEGFHTVFYQAQDFAGNLATKTETIEVIIEPIAIPTEVIYKGDTSGVYSDQITLKAQLMDSMNDVPLADRLIKFTVGAQTMTVITDSDGVASCLLILDQPAGIYMVSATFEGEIGYLDSSTTAEFVLGKESATTYYTGLTIIEEKDETLTLIATVFEENDGFLGDLTKIYVTFTLYSSADSSTPIDVIGPIMVMPTDMAGVGIAIAEVPNLDEGEYLVVVSLCPEYNFHYSSPDSDAAILTIYEPSRGKATGAGWIRDSDGNKGHFVFLVQYSCRGTLKGFAYYTVRIDNLVYFVKTTEITGFSIDGNHAFFEAICTIYVINLDMCEKIQLEESFRLRIDVWDYKKRCRNDIFQIQIFDQYGVVVYEAGFDPLGYIHRGNIVIHSYRWKHHSHHYHHWKHRSCCHHKMRHW
ncbi:MAG: OmpL47-type beta-barrel domain-containing protein [Candidatus Thorarchaeota archaeon SMTZ1-45]|nr:MAG: hypothetical protein AM325_09845 [Candidatus Thorarchaeota archaeon SMTZ1-45]